MRLYKSQMGFIKPSTHSIDDYLKILPAIYYNQLKLNFRVEGYY